MADKGSKGRFAWMAEEDEGLGAPEPPPETRQDAGPGSVAGSGGISPSSSGGARASEADAVTRAGVGVPGIARRRNRPKDPNALRNDPSRMMAGARVRRDVRRRVDQALADGEVTREGDTNYSILVESLLLRWLEEVGYPMPDS